MMPEIDACIKLLLATLFGGVIGYVREIEGKSAGLRTHILVCLGSALLTLISVYMGKEYSGVDASRIAAGVITGVGFLGAGAIIQSGTSVRGLTTAASIWIACAIGLAVGCGYYFPSLVATVIALIVIHLLREVEKKFMKKHEKED